MTAARDGAPEPEQVARKDDLGDDMAVGTITTASARMRIELLPVAASALVLAPPKNAPRPISGLRQRRWGLDAGGAGGGYRSWVILFVPGIEFMSCTPSVEIDVGRLIPETAAAIAYIFDLTVARMQALSGALQKRPGQSRQELLALDTSARPALPLLEQDAEPVDAAMPANPGAAVVLNKSTAPPPSPSMPQTQPPLAPMRGVVAGTVFEHAPPSGLPANPAPGGTTERRTDELMKQLTQIFTEIDAIVPIADFVFAVPEMPFGFFIEIPEQFLAYEDENITNLRAALWWFLVICSGLVYGEHLA